MVVHYQRRPSPAQSTSPRTAAQSQDVVSDVDRRADSRQAAIDRFRAPDGPPVMLISTKAGGVGLTLTEASRVYMMDLW
jgi:hypothetical protein